MLSIRLFALLEYCQGTSGFWKSIVARGVLLRRNITPLLYLSTNIHPAKSLIFVYWYKLDSEHPSPRVWPQRRHVCHGPGPRASGISSSWTHKQSRKPSRERHDRRHDSRDSRDGLRNNLSPHSHLYKGLSSEAVRTRRRCSDSLMGAKARSAPRLVAQLIVTRLCQWVFR